MLNFIEITGNIVWDFSFTLVGSTYILGWTWGSILTLFKRVFR